MADRVQFGGGRKQALADFLQHELNRSLGGRTEAEEHWRSLLSQYRAKPDDAVAHFPFEGASSVTMPLTQMHHDPILAMYMGNLHQSRNLWTTMPLNERWINHAKPVQDFLTWIDMMILKMWDVNMRVLGEMVLLGTSCYKTSWKYEQRNTVGYDDQWMRQRQTVIINQPVVDHVHLADLVVPPEAREVDPDAQGGAQWVAERIRMRTAQLQQLAKGQSPFLPNFDADAVKEVMGQTRNSLPDMEAEANRLERRLDGPSQLKGAENVEIWEVHIRFDTTGNGIEDDVVVHFHRETGTILRATYALMSQRPYDLVRYLRGPGFYGVGVGDQLQMWQNTVSNVMNFSIDKLLLTHTPMWSVREGANILPDEPIFPGKILMRTGDQNDITPLNFVAPGNFDMMSMLGYMQNNAQMATGLNELQQGNISSLPSRTPATTVSQMMQQSNTRFDMSIKDLRQGGLSNVGLKVLQNLQFQTQNFQNNPFAQQYAMTAAQILGQPEGQFAAEALSVPGEAIEQGIGIQLTATSGQNNRELMRQNKLALLNLGSQMGAQFIQLAQFIQQGGPVGQVAMQLFEGGAELLQQTLAEFDVRNPEEFVPNLQALLQAQQQQLAFAGQGQPPGAPPQGPPGF